MNDFEKETIAEIADKAKKLSDLLEFANKNSYEPGFIFEHNRIIFGAPGTGKSYKLKQDSKKLLDDTTGEYERVTFHPDYTYANFVGTYKPVNDGNQINYEFVPGPFLRIYVNSMKSIREGNPQPFLLIIEEINRAKVASVFGEIFQLLDRNDNGESEYEIHTSEDIKKYLSKELGGTSEDFEKIRIPNNMYIWATMNSADQGVFPMDTAFKRRWNFEYIGIDENQDTQKRKIKLGKDENEIEIDWNRLRKAINEKLSIEFKINEDKLIGPYFLSNKVLITNEDDDFIKYPDRFIEAFKNKIIMYLYEDAAKQYKYKLFEGCENHKYSDVCEAFDDIGIYIFGKGFIRTYVEQDVF